MRPHKKLDLWKRAIEYQILCQDLDDIGRMITRLSQSLRYKHKLDEK